VGFLALCHYNFDWNSEIKPVAKIPTSLIHQNNHCLLNVVLQLLVNVILIIYQPMHLKVVQATMQIFEVRHLQRSHPKIIGFQGIFVVSLAVS
jgi:hypothetical protein